jgi:DNA-binding LacI/PurR family transcriptional regulator/DNA-binding transcriptional regulator YhcF (GntR family)
MTGKVLRTAINFLNNRIEQHLAENKRRLAPYQQLASDAGVSARTMLKAMRYLRDRGILSISHGAGTTILKNPPVCAVSCEPSHENQPGPATWVRVSTMLHQDIISGTYPPGRILPSLKELEQRYGATYHRLHRALCHLTGRGVLEPHKRRYRPKALPTAAVRNTILLVAMGGEARGSQMHRFSSDRALDHFRSLQIACHQASVNLRVVSLYYNSPDGMGGLDIVDELTRKGGGKGEKILGGIVWQVNLPPHVQTSLLNSIAARGYPLCLFDESDNPCPPHPLLRSPQVWQFSMACSQRCGAMLGDYLLRKGHRNVAFIHSLPPDPDVLGRYNDLRQTIIATGGTCTMHAPVSAPAKSVYKSSSGSLNDMFGVVDSMLRRSTRSSVTRGYWNERYAYELLLISDYWLNRQKNRENLSAVFESLLQVPAVTAWVAYNDAGAMDCLDFLESRGVGVPEKIAVAGFDDSHNAIYNSLTSYNFNGDLYMRTMVEYLLRPSSGSPVAQPVIFKGYISARESA